jgi:hypothetical protein
MPGSASLAIVALLAIAESPALIDWHAPAGCPDAAEVAAMTTGLLRARSTEPATVEVHATVVGVASGFQLALELRSTHGHLKRTLMADDCLLLARAAALVVAVHLDPLAVSRSLPVPVPPPPANAVPPPAAHAVPPASAHAVPPPANAVPRPPANEVPPPPPPARQLAPPQPARGPVAPADRPRLSPETATPTAEPRPGLSPGPGAPDRSRPAGQHGGHLRLEGAVGYGVAPALAGEVALFGGADGPRWRVEAGFVTAPGREVLSDDGALGGRLHRLAGALRGCAVARLGPKRAGFAVLGCLGGEFGALGAVGTRGVGSPRTAWTPGAAVLVGPAARVRVAGPLGLLLAVEAAFALTRPTFTIDSQPVFRVGPASVRAALGLDLQFVARKRRPRATQ